MDLSSGREEQVVSGNRHGDLQREAEIWDCVPIVRLSASVILKAPIKGCFQRGSRCLMTKH